ncbi:MAG: hypothetical protein KAJ73_02790, partial [Zetaproteobacteria bacterium]|nr:hypothetical protein [Zetaproteobacteria bacterium]
HLQIHNRIAYTKNIITHLVTSIFVLYEKRLLPAFLKRRKKSVIFSLLTKSLADFAALPVRKGYCRQPVGMSSTPWCDPWTGRQNQHEQCWIL